MFDHKKVGGIHFLKIAQFRISFCATRKAKTIITETACLALGVVVCSGFAMAAFTPETLSTTPIYQLQAVTADGELFIAGQGDDCQAAQHGARIPLGWQSIICKRVN